jgi:hypothetical protein
MQTVAEDHRSEPRLALSHAVRVEPLEPSYPAEDCITLNVSGNGLYFMSPIGHYYTGMEVFVTQNFEHATPTNHRDPGKVVQVDKLRDGRWGIAVHMPGRTAGSYQTRRDHVMAAVSGRG